MKCVRRIAGCIALFAFITLAPNAIAATGRITSTSPCVIPAGQTSCAVTVSWEKWDVPIVCAWPKGSSTSFACAGINGSQSWPWAVPQGGLMELRGFQDWGSVTTYSAGVFLAQTRVYASPAFSDVPVGSSGQPEVEALYRAGLTGGCTSTQFCPGDSVSRAQMAVFLERGIHGQLDGVSYTAPTVPNPFTDVPSNDPFLSYMAKAANEGLIPVCATNQFCPGTAVTRRAMAYMLLRARYGSLYTPPLPPPTARFTDVPVGDPDRAWIEQLAAEGITLGCGGTTYCPNALVSRAAMAIFLARTFGLPNGATTATTKYFGYFGMCDNVNLNLNPPVTCGSETSKHSNLAFPLGWGDWTTTAGINAITDNTVDHLKEAKKLGVRSAFVTVDYLVFIGTGTTGQGFPRTPRLRATAIANLTTFFDRLRAEQLLPMVVGIYPVDEPDQDMNSTNLTTTNSLIREVAARYGALENVKLAVLYSQYNDTLGLESYDWPGFFHYEIGASIFNAGGEYDTFRNQLYSWQRTLLVPGGRNPWATPPTAFLSKLQSDSRALGMIPFLWIDGSDNELGIRSNGQRTAYCQAGATVKGVTITCP